MRINLLDLCGSACIDPREAAALGRPIGDAISHEPVVLDFEGVETVTASFLTACLVRLHDESPMMLDCRISAIGLSDANLELFEIVLRSMQERAQFRRMVDSEVSALPV